MYVLQQRNSPLVDRMEKLEADMTEIMEWGRAYENKKREFFEKYEMAASAVYQMLQVFPERRVV